MHSNAGWTLIDRQTTTPSMHGSAVISSRRFASSGSWAATPTSPMTSCKTHSWLPCTNRFTPSPTLGLLPGCNKRCATSGSCTSAAKAAEPATWRPQCSDAPFNHARAMPNMSRGRPLCVAACRSSTTARDRCWNDTITRAHLENSSQRSLACAKTASNPGYDGCAASCAIACYDRSTNRSNGRDLRS